MKLIALILFIIFLVFATRKAPVQDFMERTAYVDTSILGPVLADQGDEDTSTDPPPDTIPVVIGPRNNLIFEELYNDLPIDQKVFGFQTVSGSCCAWSQNLRDTFFNTSPTANRFEIKLSDPLTGSSHRSEDNYPSNGEPTLTFERWFGMKVYFPTNYLNDRSPEAFVQFHANDNSPPPVALWTLNGNIYFAYSGGTVQSYGAIPKGSWNSFVFHIKWDTDAANNGAAEGIIEIWMNGVLLTQRFGKNSPAGLTYGPYPKWGLYKWPWIHLDRYVTDIDDRVIWIDDVRYGSALATYSDVVPI